ncbi:ATP-binding cassette domain-containing protein [Paenibacillus sp. JSM ZJ436]|uniref:ATP-binding cassette domain-containing protein n=1 Tax=Paenibacillus sp. JSM ZJ436 TaxID=3376190 RepID=UPI00379F5B77
MIQLLNVSKSYNGVQALDQISATIPQGQITSITGPQGSGKSSLLSMISRVISKDSGEIWLDGKEINHWKSTDLSRKTSILKQTRSIGLRLTVRELVAFGRFPHSRGQLNEEDHQYMDEALDSMDLRKLQHTYMHQLNEDDTQRAYIAMIIAQNSDYVLLDEPFQQLNVQQCEDMMYILRRLAAEGQKTIVLAHPEHHCAFCNADCVFALRNGRIEAS